MEKILIVEDDRKIAELERDYLESNGYETVLLEDGAQVLSEIEANRYDLVLLDIMLPDAMAMRYAVPSEKRLTFPF